MSSDSKILKNKLTKINKIDLDETRPKNLSNDRVGLMKVLSMW